MKQCLTRICFVRHGETDWNVEKRMQGYVDTLLSTYSVTQAERLAKALLSTWHRFDRIYSSDLDRAFHSAKAITSPQFLEIMVRPDLRGCHVGKLHGLPLADAPQLEPALWQLHQARYLEYDFWRR